VNYKKNLIDIISEWVAAIPTLITINSVSTSGDLHTISVCDVLYAQPGFEVIIGSNTYTIVSVDQTTKEIVVQGSVAITASSFNLYSVKFYHGTPIQTSAELDQEHIASEKTPMIYLLELFKERFFESDLDTAFERESTIRLFALTQADFDKKLTSEFYSDYILPMRNLMENLIAIIKEDKFTDATELESLYTNHARFGVYITNKGVEKSLFLDNLSGVEIEITIPRYKEGKCLEC
jgi:hypothetical protein